MSLEPFNLRDRAFEFATRVVKLCDFLNQRPGVTRDLSKPLMRSGTAIGAVVEASQAAQSKDDFLNKLAIALQEARETRYWLRLLLTTQLVSETRLVSLLNEVNELVTILTAVMVKTKQNHQN